MIFKTSIHLYQPANVDIDSASELDVYTSMTIPSCHRLLYSSMTPSLSHISRSKIRGPTRLYCSADVATGACASSTKPTATAATGLATERSARLTSHKRPGDLNFDILQSGSGGGDGVSGREGHGDSAEGHEYGGGKGVEEEHFCFVLID